MNNQKLDFFLLTNILKKEHPVILWVDDERDPYANVFRCDYTWVEYVVGKINPGNWNVIWLKNYKQFTNWIELEGLPDVICFDHDLGEQLTGKDCANYLMDILIEKDMLGPVVRCQSSNPCGKQDILNLINNWWIDWTSRHPEEINQ